MKVPEGCTCRWEDCSTVPLIEVPVMAIRNTDCLVHGDDTEWYRRTRAWANALLADAEREADRG